MAGLGQLAKLTTRGMRLEPGSGGTGGLKWDDVAAGLRKGRRLWIDDQAAFIAGLETRAEQAYWFREIRAHKPQWAAQIGARVAEMQNVKMAA